MQISESFPGFPVLLFFFFYQQSTVLSGRNLLLDRGETSSYQYVLCRVSKFWEMQEKQTEGGDGRSENVDPAQKVI